MENPMRSVRLEGRSYKYDKTSFRETIALKNRATPTQNSTTFSTLGGTLPSFSIAIILENTYTPMVNGNPSPDGATTWNGVSRYADLKNFMTATGVSLPITFVTPYGATYSVVPTGTLDMSEYLESPQDAGVEFRVSINLEAQS